MSKKKLARMIVVCIIAISIIVVITILPSCQSQPPTPPTYGLEFDGIDDYVNVGRNASVQNFTAKTVELWLKPTAYTGSYRYVFDGSYWGTDYGDMVPLENNTNKLCIYVKNTAGNATWKTIDYTPDEWLQIGYSWDGTTVAWYKNGVNAGNSSLSGTLACSARNLTFGESADGYLYYGGLMSEVRIWNYARTEEEIQADMYSELLSLIHI